MLTSRQNPLVKLFRKLHQTKERHRQQLFLLEGTHLVEEACAAQLTFTALCYTDRWQAAHPELCQQAIAQSERAEIVSPDVISALATTVHPDGVVAIAPRQVASAVPRNIQLGLAIETLQDPGNLGTLIRTAAATGVDGVWLSDDSVDLDHPKVLRASAGQWFRVPMTTTPDLKSVIADCRSQGVQVIATLPTAEKTYWDVDLTQPSLILIGSEGAGLSEAIAGQADSAVRIPLMPGVESLNASISAALMLYEVVRQRSG